MEGGDNVSIFKDSEEKNMGTRYKIALQANSF